MLGSNGVLRSERGRSPGQGRQAPEFGLYPIDSREPLRVHPKRVSGGSEGDRRKGLAQPLGRSSWESVLWRGKAYQAQGCT